jgi:hypothetical protein
MLMPSWKVRSSIRGVACESQPSSSVRRRNSEQLNESSRQTYVSPFEVALIYVGLGRKNEALQWLERAYTERSDLLIYLNVDPRLNSIGSDPQFIDLAHRVGLSGWPVGPPSFFEDWESRFVFRLGFLLAHDVILVLTLRRRSPSPTLLAHFAEKDWAPASSEASFTQLCKRNMA